MIVRWVRFARVVFRWEVAAPVLFEFLVPAIIASLELVVCRRHVYWWEGDEYLGRSNSAAAADGLC
jgi:hypothetical protein